MTTFKDLDKDSDLSEFKKLRLGDLRLLWHNSFWDGPINGILIYQGRKCWFESIVDLEEDIRQFVIIELTPEQLKEEEYWHKLFQEYVGMHTDYDENNKRTGKCKPKDLYDKFYNPYRSFREKNPRDYSNNKVLAIFSIGQIDE